MTSRKTTYKIQLFRWILYFFKSTAYILRFNIFILIFLIDGILRRMCWFMVCFILLYLLYLKTFRFLFF